MRGTPPVVGASSFAEFITASGRSFFNRSANPSIRLSFFFPFSLSPSSWLGCCFLNYLS